GRAQGRHGGTAQGASRSPARNIRPDRRPVVPAHRLRLAGGRARRRTAVRLPLLHGPAPLADRAPRGRARDRGQCRHPRRRGRAAAGDPRGNACHPPDRAGPVRRRHQAVARPLLRHRGQRQPQHRRRRRGLGAQGRALYQDHAVLPRRHRETQGRAPGMSATLGLFEGFGIEIEYMIVDAGSLDVMPVTDRAIRAVAGEYVNEVERGPLAWSNELALHVIELKTNGPAPSLAPLPAVFQAGVDEVNAVLAGMGARLMPGPMHPWMDPHTESRLWPHDYNPIYETYNRIFDCRGHGWSNLQSMHVNLPFAGEDDFVRLHAAIRAALPILPMLAAGSPYCDGRAAGAL